MAGMDPSIAPVLRTALRSAMRERDRPAVDAIRSALARIANAEAVPIETVPRAGAIEEAAIGVGVADAPRRVLDEAEMRTLVAATGRPTVPGRHAPDRFTVMTGLVSVNP